QQQTALKHSGALLARRSNENAPTIMHPLPPAATSAAALPPSALLSSTQSQSTTGHPIRPLQPAPFLAEIRASRDPLPTTTGKPLPLVPGTVRPRGGGTQQTPFTPGAATLGRGGSPVPRAGGGLRNSLPPNH